MPASSDLRAAFASLAEGPGLEQTFNDLVMICASLYDFEEQSHFHYFSGGIADPEPVKRRSKLASDTKVTLVPADINSSEYTHAELLKRASLYSDLVAIMLPFTADNERYPEKDREPVRFTANDRLQDLSTLNASFSALVRDGRCVFLPERLVVDEDKDAFGDQGMTVFEKSYDPPLLDGFERWLPLNATERFGDPSDYFVFKHIVIPYFPGLDLTTIGRISTQETDSFTRFNRYLCAKLAELGDAGSASTIDGLFGEIDNEVARVSLEAKKLMKSRFMRGAEIASFSIALAGSMVTDVPMIQGVAAAVGSVTLLEILKERRQARDTRLDLAKEPFYFPYLLKREADRRGAS